MMIAKNAALRPAALVREFAGCMKVLLLLVAILGIAYPAVVTLVAQTLMPEKAGGSLFYKDGAVAGSTLIGQNFAGSGLFEGRPSAVGWNAAASGGSNYSVANPEQLKLIAERKAYWQAKLGEGTAVPADLLTASSSGLDPHISVEAARFQVPLVAGAKGIGEATLHGLIDKLSERGLFGGRDFVNVVMLNRAVLEAASK